MAVSSSFIFTVCQVGAEKALKDEISREHPDLRFAFSRPGFLTFKSPGAPLNEDFALKSIFSRAYGLSLGEKLKNSTMDVGALAAQVVEKVSALRQSVGQSLRLHVFERESFAPGEEPMGYEPGKWAALAEQAILARAEAKELFLEGDFAQASDPVLDVICVEEGEWWLGYHRHVGGHSPVPGARWKIEMPEDAPSRAYLKLEEAIRWSGAPVRKGDQAVEIGSAPGGASYALLQRGVNVVGIDPGEMDPQVMDYSKAAIGRAHFEHIARSVVTVTREELPESVEWLLVDMNVGPDTALGSVYRLGSRMEDSLVGVILTLKLNEWDFAKHIPNWLDRIKQIRLSRVRATQLSHNRREICVVGLTHKGISRLI